METRLLRELKDKTGISQADGQDGEYGQTVTGR